MKLTCKNIILVLLIIAGQLHELLPDDHLIEWIVNGKIKSIKFAWFLFSMHITTFVALYYALRPKNINKNLLLFLVVSSFYDVLHFFISSSFGFVEVKILISGITFVLLKSKFNKWAK